VEPEEDETLDLALAAAFTSISLRDRWRDPVVDTDFVLTVEALVMREEMSVRPIRILKTYTVNLVLYCFSLK
jgi:hypothetical protein